MEDSEHDLACQERATSHRGKYFPSRGEGSSAPRSYHRRRQVGCPDGHDVVRGDAGKIHPVAQTSGQAEGQAAKSMLGKELSLVLTPLALTLILCKGVFWANEGQARITIPNVASARGHCAVSSFTSICSFGNGGFQLAWTAGNGHES
jgi:hypothetical protein